MYSNNSRRLNNHLFLKIKSLRFQYYKGIQLVHASSSSYFGKMDARDGPRNAHARMSRRHLSITSAAVLVLLSSFVGGHIGYSLGFNAANNQQFHNDGESLECICPMADKNLEIVTIHEEKEPCPVVTCDNDSNEKEKSSANNNGKLRFPQSIEEFAVGMTRIPRDDFVKEFDLGVSMTDTTSGNEHVLMLYSHVDAAPNNTESAQSEGGIGITSVLAATGNCDFLNVILTQSSGFQERRCVAIIGQTESSHIQRWARVPENGSGLNPSVPLRFVGRVARDFGDEIVPSHDNRQMHWTFLRKYMTDLDSIMMELKPLAQKVAKNNTLIVMFSNFGQSELIVNFCCSARNRNLDISPVLFFATDIETKELVESLGMTAFYNEAIFGRLPLNAADIYGDDTFNDMMKAKVVCLHLASLLGYDILFQDADIIWYRDPLLYFHNNELAHFDVLIADDGNDLSM
jgi:hypothetical protein